MTTLCHTPYTGPAPKTKAAAKKIRAKIMKACGCQYCTWALEKEGKFSPSHLEALRQIEAERRAEAIEVARMEAHVGEEAP
jgi:hypothetical protein